MKLTTNQIKTIYKSIADLYGERINHGGEPEDDTVYNELNAAFASLQAALEKGFIQCLYHPKGGFAVILVDGMDFNRERQSVCVCYDVHFAPLYLFSAVHSSAFAFDAGSFNALAVYQACTWRYLTTLLLTALRPQNLVNFFYRTVFFPFVTVVIN
jgi:hypothetical protein